MVTAWLIYFVIGGIAAVSAGIWCERTANRIRAAAHAEQEPPRKRLGARQTTEQFVARIVAEAEASDPANWWKRGEAPAEWSDDRISDNRDWSC